MLALILTRRFETGFRPAFGYVGEECDAITPEDALVVLGRLNYLYRTGPDGQRRAHLPRPDPPQSKILDALALTSRPSRMPRNAPRRRKPRLRHRFFQAKLFAYGPTEAVVQEKIGLSIDDGSGRRRPLPRHSRSARLRSRRQACSDCVKGCVGWVTVW